MNIQDFNEKVAEYERELISHLPQVEYVMDQVSEAVKIVKEANGPENSEHLFAILSVAIEAAKTTAKISEPGFYRTKIVLGALLYSIEGILENEKIMSRFDNSTKRLEEIIKRIPVDGKVIAERGCFKAILLHLCKLNKEDQEVLHINLHGIKRDLEKIVEGMDKLEAKTPCTTEDLAVLLGYSYVFANFKSDGLLDYNRTVRNDISIILNKVII